MPKYEAAPNLFVLHPPDDTVDMYRPESMTFQALLAVCEGTKNRLYQISRIS